MDPALPWYRSPVYVGIVAALISQLLSLAGKAELFPAEQVNGFVEAVFQVLAIVATCVAEWKRRKSKDQPLTLTKAAAAAVPASPPGVPPR